MQTAKRRSFTEDYKRQTVELVRSSGRSVGSVASEIGLAETVLRKWMSKFGVAGQPAARRGAPRRRRRCRRLTRPPRSLGCSGRTTGCGWSATF